MCGFDTGVVRYWASRLHIRNAEEDNKMAEIFYLVAAKLFLS